MTTVDCVVINVCNSFVGEASLDSSSPDFVPSLFVYTQKNKTPKTKMERYKNNKKVSYLSIKLVCFSLTQYAGLLAAPFF